jgi:glutathione-regulated potassium-efflux system ancillary protein KefG
VLVLFCHPALEHSRVHRAMLRAAQAVPGLSVHDLYEAYPDFDIDVRREQALLAAHDVVVAQFPLYWYSTPALLKQWQDLVLEHGWAYGRDGRALAGKQWLTVVSSGGGEAAYHAEGLNRRTVREFLAPLEQTARLCGMTYLPPMVAHGTHRLEHPAIDAIATLYGRLLDALREGRLAFPPDAVSLHLPQDVEALLAAGARQ